MATDSPIQLYLDEFIEGFEQRQTILRDMVTNEAIIKGLSATFLVVNTARAAVTRGSNGLIPAASDNQQQITVTLVEDHDLIQKTGFNIFTGQADQRKIMQMGGMAVINRAIDQAIIAQLATATTNTGGAVAMSKTLINKAITKLFNNQVQNDGNLYGLLTPAAWAYLSDVTSFGSSDFVGFENRPLVEGPEMKKWLGVKWLMHPNLPGFGTNAASCFIFHKAAIGHAVDRAGMQAPAGYHQEQDYSWARHSLYHGAKLLQNAGVVIIASDDSAIS